MAQQTEYIGDTNKTMTAIDWFTKELEKQGFVLYDLDIKKAKEMEKNQIIRGWEFGFNDGWNTRENDYNPNYHKKGTGKSYYDWEFNYEYGKI